MKPETQAKLVLIFSAAAIVCILAGYNVVAASFLVMDVILTLFGNSGE